MALKIGLNGSLTIDWKPYQSGKKFWLEVSESLAHRLVSRTFDHRVNSYREFMRNKNYALNNFL